MIDGFDKEIDSLLRRTARAGGAAFAPGSNSEIRNPKSPHLDADEILLFAEKALPVKRRALATGHLADCERCRKILSGLIAFNSEPESENVHAKDDGDGALVAAPAVAGSLPWYKKLLAFPQMAYAMGALALVFSGVIAVMVWQNARQGGNASVARVEEAREKSAPAPGGKGMSSEGGESASGEYYGTPAADPEDSDLTTTTGTSNTAMTSSNTAAAGKPPVTSSSANANAVTSSRDERMTLDGVESNEPAPPPPAPAAAQSKPEAPKDKAAAAADAKTKEDFVPDGPAPAKRENESRADNDDASRRARQLNELALQDNSAARAQQIAPGADNVQRLPHNNRKMTKSTADGVVTSSDAPATTTAGTQGARAGESKKKNAAAAAGGKTRSAGGKTFTYADGVWYDTDYNRRGTTNVRRGTEAFNKLDEGLRAIARQIDGTVIVVWKGKAYRIQ